MKEIRRKILFICGSFSSGKDGVGDYTLAIAQCLNDMGHATSILAIHDKYLLDQPSIEKIHGSVPILRIQSTLNLAAKQQLIKSFFHTHSPEYVSLQFVPFAFQKRGLPFNLPKLLKTFSNVKWQIMFHELWVGMEVNDSMKLKIWGKLQNIVIRRVIKSLKPSIIHTSNPTYLNALKHITKQPVKELPIFSNIKKTSSREIGNAPKEHLKFVLFAGIHQGAPVMDFVEWLHDQSITYKFKPSILFVGKNGNYLSEWVAILQANHIHHQIFGVQNADFISSLLSESDIGLSTTPYYLSGKSGSLAAMVEHGLPILNVARNWMPIGMTNLSSLTPNFVIKWNKQLSVNDILESKSSPNYLQDVSRRFLADLNI